MGTNMVTHLRVLATGPRSISTNTISTMSTITSHMRARDITVIPGQAMTIDTVLDISADKLRL
jgi:predicted Rossmann fold nucleotide-binding protein DprA/Smf involved in DNA uptake